MQRGKQYSSVRSRICGTVAMCAGQALKYLLSGEGGQILNLTS